MVLIDLGVTRRTADLNFTKMLKRKPHNAQIRMALALFRSTAGQGPGAGGDVEGDDVENGWLVNSWHEQDHKDKVQKSGLLQGGGQDLAGITSSRPTELISELLEEAPGTSGTQRGR